MMTIILTMMMMVMMMLTMMMEVAIMKSERVIVMIRREYDGTETWKVNGGGVT